MLSVAALNERLESRWLRLQRATAGAILSRRG
jgi:hypothetical protein